VCLGEAMVKRLLKDLPLSFYLAAVVQLLQMTSPALGKMAAEWRDTSFSGFQYPDNFSPDKRFLFFHRAHKEAISRNGEWYKNNFSRVVRKAGSTVDKLLNSYFEVVDFLFLFFHEIASITSKARRLKGSFWAPIDGRCSAHRP